MGEIFVKSRVLVDKTVNAERPKKPYIVLEDFLALPVAFYRSIGVEPCESHQKTSFALHLYFAFILIDLSFTMGMQLFLAWISDDFFESMEVLSYSSFGVAGFLKILTVQMQKHKMTSLVAQLRSSFPSPREDDQTQYAVKHYFRRYSLYAKAFAGLFVALVSTYVLAAIGQYVLQRWLLRLANPKQAMPFLSLLPWEWRDSWRYYPTYLLQSISGYTAACGHISCDIMIYAVVMQVIMHFDRLSRALREFGVRGQADEDLKELRSLIAYHNQIIGLTDLMNEIFGIPLLLNFLTSSLLVCNVGFQLTMGFSMQQMGQLLLFLTCGLVEVYLICLFSQMLIDASENVSFAAYDMNWTETDSRFRKMLVFLCLRAQKPVCLKATVFLDISVGTMSIFLRVSYKFFCAVRSMYS